MARHFLTRPRSTISQPGEPPQSGTTAEPITTGDTVTIGRQPDEAPVPGEGTATPAPAPETTPPA
ncbi:MAG TPA: hypothetical protein VKB59_22530 [Micromonosporaceae bacterium]|nr:hypothetical protein [Micromonosporaceae bacterium]